MQHELDADELAALRRDADRYRWLREHTYVEGYYIDGAGGVDTAIHVQGSVHFLDAAIDAAKTAPGKGGR